jgi:hypothetical protein
VSDIAARCVVPPESLPSHPPGRLRRGLERVALGAATTLIGINLWTGFPLLALWIGSRTVGSSGLSGTAVFVVVAVLAVLLAGGVMVLTRLSARYDRITGRPPPTRQVAPWMRSMRAERVSITRRGRRPNTVERIVIACVVLAVIGFEVWFFFFAGSSLPREA